MRADAVTRALLDFSAGTELKPSLQDVNGVLQRALLLVHHALTKAHISVVEEFESGLPPAMLDQNKIEQVLVNLIINAIDAMPDGGTLVARTRRDRIRVGSRAIVVEIEDTGTGIQETSRARLFDPFFTTKPASPSSRCMEARLESRIRGVATAHEPQSSSGASGPRRKETAMDKVRILLIDDEPSFTRMLKMNLQHRGFKVMVENNGAYAYTAARDFLPDLIFLDVIMPDVDGGDVAAKIRSDPRFNDVPIVFLTAGVSKESTRVRGNIIGGQTYLAKPVTVDEVVRCIDKELQKQAGVRPDS